MREQILLNPRTFLFLFLLHKEKMVIDRASSHNKVKIEDGRKAPYKYSISYFFSKGIVWHTPAR